MPGPRCDIPGVIAVYLAADLSPLVQNHRVDDEPPQRERPFRLLADGDVRYVGEPVAMVVADSRYHAEDGVDAVVIDIEPDIPLVDPTRALDDDVPRVHPEEASNVYVDVPAAPNPALDEVFASAPVVVTETFRQHRYATVPMETRGILASWDRVREELTVWISTQGPHGVRGQMARVLGLEDSQVHVIMPDVGGAFGLKMHPRPEELAVVLATKLLGRPVKWIQDRRENLMADEHARHDHATVTMAADEDGTLLATKVDFLEVAGSFPSPGGSAAVFTTILFPGPYRIPLFGASASSVHTNMPGRGAYRGPWMVETVAREQMIDCVAARLGMDPLELRRRNVITDDEMPYVMPTGMAYDQMTAAATLEQAAEKIGYDEFRAKQREWRAEGRLVGHRREPVRRTDVDGVRFHEHRRRDRAHRSQRQGRRRAHGRESWAEPRNDDRAGRGRRARRRLRPGARDPRRHRQDAVRSRHRREPQRGDSRRRGPARGAAKCGIGCSRSSPINSKPPNRISNSSTDASK